MTHSKSHGSTRQLGELAHVEVCKFERKDSNYVNISIHYYKSYRLQLVLVRYV
jgi:hypothetical protein